MPNKLHPKQSRVTSWSQLRHWRWACASHMVGKPWRQRNDRGNICHVYEWMTVTVPNHNYSTGPIDRVCSRLLLWLLQFVHPVVQWNIQKKPFRLNINGTFRYNTSAEHEGRARTIHTSGLKCKNKQKKILNIHYLQMTGWWSLCPGFTHAVETCEAKGLYTAVPDATKSYSHTLW